jgi:hypothetical protein
MKIKEGFQLVARSIVGVIGVLFTLVAVIIISPVLAVLFLLASPFAIWDGFNENPRRGIWVHIFGQQTEPPYVHRDPEEED